MTRPRRRRRRRRGVLHALRRREAGRLGAAPFSRAVYSALVPSSTFVSVQSVPNLYFRRFTSCGQYLTALDPNNCLIVFRFETGGRKTAAVTSAHPSDAQLYDTFAFSPRSSSHQEDYHHFDLSPPPTSLTRRSSNPSLLLSLPVPIATPPSPLQSPSPAQKRPTYTCHFAQFFTHMYTVPIATGAAHVARDFSISTTSGKYLILASYQPQDPPQTGLPAVSWLPSLAITLYLVEVRTGLVADRYVLLDDYVKFDSHDGVHFYGDMLCILSMRHQLLHIVKIQEALGKFTEERCIGAMCNRDDYQVIARAREAQNAFIRQQPAANQPTSPQSRKQDQKQLNPTDATDAADAADANAAIEDGHHGVEPGSEKETGLGNGMRKEAFYTGLMQRLLVYVYRRMHSEGNDSLFYRVIGQYSLLVMRKAQFLDDDHLLIRLGSCNGSEHGLQQQSVVARETCFFVVYCMSSTRVVNLFENRSTQLLRTFHMYREDFVGDEMEAASLPPPRSSVLDDGNRGDESNDESVGRRERNNERADWTWSGTVNRRGFGDRVRRTRLELSHLPVSRQVRMVSPYLDRSLFSYNADRSSVLTARRFVAAKDLGSIKFMSAETGGLRFKLATEFSLLGGETDGEREGVEMGEAGRRRRMFLFHPLLPFVLAMEEHRPVNFHVYGHAE
ncbi:unnamed protein product [Agarophyton chilense]